MSSFTGSGSENENWDGLFIAKGGNRPEGSLFCKRLTFRGDSTAWYPKPGGGAAGRGRGFLSSLAVSSTPLHSLLTVVEVKKIKIQPNNISDANANFEW